MESAVKASGGKTLRLFFLGSSLAVFIGLTFLSPPARSEAYDSSCAGDSQPDDEVVLDWIDGLPTFVVAGRPAARMCDAYGKMAGLYQLYRDNVNRTIVLQLTQSDAQEQTARYEGNGWRIEDRFERIGPRLFRIRRTWFNLSTKEQRMVLSCELNRPGEIAFFMVPGVTYNGNRRWPRARFQGLAAPMSPLETSESISRNQWIFPGDWSSLPACSITEGEGLVVGLFAEPKDAGESACSLESQGPGMVQRLWWPRQQQPYQITGSGRCVQAPWENEFLWPGDSCQRVFYVVAGQVVATRLGYAVVLDEAWKQFDHAVPIRFDAKKVWELGIRYAKESLWTETDRFTGFFFSLEPKDGMFVQTSWPWRFEIGFVGQAAALGAFMIQDFLWHEDDDSWRRGKAALDFWAKNGRFPSGLFYTRYDDKLAWKEDPRLSTRNLGDGAYFYLLAAELAEKAGRPQPLWKETGLDVCNFFCRNMLADGKFGKYWKASGLLDESPGTIGCFLLPALIKAYRMTREKLYLTRAQRAFRSYADDDLDAVCLTGGAIDADTIDKETGLPLLTAGLDLHDITGDPYYLEMAKKAAYYLASWQYHYSIDFPKGTPAADLNYDAFGGTSVAVGGGGADQGGAIIALGWLRLHKVTGDDIWRRRALATWGHTTTGISDGTLKLNGKLLPAGAQYEGFVHSQGRRGYSSRLGYGTEWLCAWCTAFRLWTIQHWPDWEDLE